MKHFFTIFKNLKLVNFDCDYLELMPGVRVTNKKEIKDRILTDSIKDIIGVIETSYIYSADTFVYFEYEDDEIPFAGLDNLQSLNTILLWIDDFLKNSWIFRDNCIICDTGYLIDNKTENVNASSLRLQYLFTSASGLITNIELCKSDLTSLFSIHDKIETYLHGKKSGLNKFMLEKDFSRIGRALLFIKQAREARNLAYKISNYCAALETLFTTENTELSHKLSERVAFFANDNTNKLNIYKTIKKAYSIRSKLTHGSSIDQKTIDEIPDVSIQTDKILRAIFEKIISDGEILKLFDSSSNTIDEYFEKLIFG